MCTPAFPLLFRHPLLSRRLVTPPVLFSVVSRRSFRHISRADRPFMPPSHRKQLPLKWPGSPQLQPPDVFGLFACAIGARFLGLTARSTACSLRACLRTLFTAFSASNSLIFIAVSSTPSANALTVPSLYGPRVQGSAV